MPKEGEQLKFDFETTAEEIAAKYGIVGDAVKNVSRKGTMWFYKDEPIDKWKETIDELYSTKDSDELYKH